MLYTSSSDVPLLPIELDVGAAEGEIVGEEGVYSPKLEGTCHHGDQPRGGFELVEDDSETQGQEETTEAPVTTNDEIAALIHNCVSTGGYEVNLCLREYERCVSTEDFAHIVAMQPPVWKDGVCRRAQMVEEV